MNAENVKVIHCANDGVFDVAGATVFNVRLSLKDAFMSDWLISFMSEQPPGFFPMTIAQKSGHCMPGLKSKVYRSIIPSPDRWDEANY